MATENTIDEYTKILTAVSWESESEQTEFGDLNYRAFVKVMTYRREIAKRYFDEPNEENRKHIREILEHCNDNIKKILGL